MYTLGKHTGYSNRVTNTHNPSIIDYVPDNYSGYSSRMVNTFSGLVDYIENRNYYACTLITVHPPVTWDIWAQNWELIDTNWNNDII